MLFVCREDNDLYRLLVTMGASHPRYDSFDVAVHAAQHGQAVLLLADEYPKPGAAVGEEQLAIAREKQLRLYLEYPSSLPGVAMESPCPTQWERVAVSSDFFAGDVAPNTILAMHGCWYTPVHAEDPHLVVARIAGYHTAVYGLPENASPILFELPGYPVLVATSKLSQFITGRYGPAAAWQAIWQHILHWLAPDEAPSSLVWEPSVVVEASKDEPLPAQAEQAAFQRAVRWFREQIVFSTDAKKGALEGFESGIDHLGRQMRRAVVRADCTGETLLVFAQDWAVRHDPTSRQLAGQMLDYVWSAPDFFQSDPTRPDYGLNNWYLDHAIFYGDDNARVILPSLLASRMLDDSRWDEAILRCLLANFRTTGALGFRHPNLRFPESFTDGRDWRFFSEEEFINYSPHYQAYPWACYLWGYALTGYTPFLDRTKTAIRMTMDAYPAWRWTNGFTQEMARMLLPLAFLVRVEDTPEHRGWLMRIATDLLAQMQPTGAIYEKFGPIETGAYPPPQSNESYGTAEASLIQQPGDPACDLLYTANFAFLGLHEAAAATGDAMLREAEDRLADFFCRIQLRSISHPEFDGAWMRSFDDQLWEYWGSSADLGWGAWCIESGWTNAWIAAVLAMRHQGTTLYDVHLADRLMPIFPRLRDEMMPELTYVP